MRVVVDLKALEALCDAAEDKHRLLVNRLRNSVRAEPKTEEISKVADYIGVDLNHTSPLLAPPNYGSTPNKVVITDNTSDVTAVEQACTFAPRKRSAVSDK